MTKKLKVIILTMGILGMFSISNSIAFGMNDKKKDIMFDDFLVINNSFDRDSSNREIDMDEACINDTNGDYTTNPNANYNNIQMNNPLISTEQDKGHEHVYNLDNKYDANVTQVANKLQDMSLYAEKQDNEENGFDSLNYKLEKINDLIFEISEMTSCSDEDKNLIKKSIEDSAKELLQNANYYDRDNSNYYDRDNRMYNSDIKYIIHFDVPVNNQNIKINFRMTKLNDDIIINYSLPFKPYN